MHTVKTGEVYETHGDGTEAVTVEDGGWCVTFDDSYPTITVKDGGKCWTCNNSHPAITIEDGGKCWTFDDSYPTITVETGGVFETYGNSHPTVIQTDREGCEFTSEWDDGSVVTTPCVYDDTGWIDPEVSKGPVPTGCLIREYITLKDGDELEVCHNCHEYVLRTVMNEGVGKSLYEAKECPNPDCPEHVLEGD